MTRWLPLLLLCLAGALWLRAQEIVPAPLAGTGAVPPSSLRLTGPFDDAHPAAAELTFGYDAADNNHLYVWHNNHWRTCLLVTPQTP